LSKSALYQTITVSSGFFVYGLGFIQMYILTPIECLCFGTIFILLAVLRNRVGSRTNKRTQVSTDELSLEIEHNLKLFHDFWEEKQGYLNKPLSLSRALRGAQQIVVSRTENSITTDSIDYIEHDIDLPQWHRKEFDKPTFLYGLSAKEKQSVKQFYDNLGQITSKYEKIKKLGNKVVRRTILNEKLETLAAKVFEQGNPLKTT
jgi:hypothetical protein